MSDADCTAFLQWALPRRDLRWSGFRKVRGQVCKRLKRRIGELQLADFAAYRARLERDSGEWQIFDRCCRITISRFFRDARIFQALRERVLPAIAARAGRQRRQARAWSAGCASGEEPYTLRILWDLEVARSVADASLSIIATDVDETMLARARQGCFSAGSLRELPPYFRQAFEREGNLFCLQRAHRNEIDFMLQDLRTAAPAPRFDLILCRYLAFTYFSLGLQHQVLERILDRLLPNGYLVIGTHERLPGDVRPLAALAGCPQIFQKISAA